MATKLACRECHEVVLESEAEDEECPKCGSSLSDDWKGYVTIIEPENSEIAEKMEVNEKGKFALKVR
ncbi:MAG: transcription elongation factor subunit Spt4 [Halobacteria archaeon]|nr:transcription elongation factor subunit Spt4 [Halobacteria archaeon]